MEYPRLCPFRYYTEQGTPLDFIVPATSNYHRPWKWYAQTAENDFGSTIENGKEKFTICLDVRHFRPDEISVKASEKEIVIEGKHEERQDEHGFVTRQFKRRYVLPNNFPSENVVSNLSADGVLTVIADREATKSTEKIVPISLLGVRPRTVTKETRTATGITQKDIDDTIREANELISKNKAQITEEHSHLLKPELLGEIKETVEKIELETSNGIPSTFGEKGLLGVTSNKLDEAMEKLGVSSLAEVTESNLASSSACTSLKMLSESRHESSSSLYKSSVSSSTKMSEKTGDLHEVVSAELRGAAGNI